MNIVLRQVNLALLISASAFLIFGLLFLALGYEQMSSDTFLLTSIAFPIFLALKGIEFMLDNQTTKAYLSIIILSLICILTIIFVFI